MIAEEFHHNQNFMYPEEYDLYDQQLEKGLKKNFKNSKDVVTDHKAKIHDAKTDLYILEQFRKRDLVSKNIEERERQQHLEQEMKLEKFIQNQAISYHSYMASRQNKKKEDTGLTLRAVLSFNYQEILANFPELTKERFPHITYGQDVSSETFQKSFPQSYKRYFFRLVKGIIVNSKNKKVINKNPVSCIMTGASRGSTLQDKFIAHSYNTRLQHFKVAKQIKERWAKYPLEFRSRVFKKAKQDDKLEEKLQNIFMKFEEVENCTFEPNCGK